MDLPGLYTRLTRVFATWACAQVVHTLLSASANPMARDHKGRTPVDYATISPGVWPFFGGKAQSCGCCVLAVRWRRPAARVTLPTVRT